MSSTDRKREGTSRPFQRKPKSWDEIGLYGEQLSREEIRAPSVPPLPLSFSPFVVVNEPTLYSEQVQRRYKLYQLDL